MEVISIGLCMEAWGGVMGSRTGDFTLRQLDTFVCAARSGSFALAADQLGISQPAVSDHISALERHLGHSLFRRRRGTTPVLTPEGLDMLLHAESLLSTSKPLRQRDAAPVNEQVKIRLSIGHRSRETILKPLLARIYTTLPQVELEVAPPVAMDRIADAMEAREIDLLLAVVGRTPGRLPNMHLLEDVPIAMVAAPEIGHLLDSGTLAREDLQFILPDFSAIADRWLEQQIIRAGIHPRRAIRHLGFADVIQKLVEDGLGVSILLEDQVAPAIADGRLIRLDVDLTPMHRILARSPAAPRAAEMLERLFIEEVRRQSKRG